MVVVKKSSQTSKATLPSSNKVTPAVVSKTSSNTGKSSQISSTKPTQIAKTFPIAKSHQGNKSSLSQASKASPNDNATKLDQKDRAIIPKSKIPPSVSNFEEVAQDPLKHILQFTKKRLRNLESRKVSFQKDINS